MGPIGGRFPLALGALQILCLDIGTDLMPALALGAEPPTSRALTRPPMGRHLIDPAHLHRAFAVLGPTEALLEMSAFVAALLAAGWRPGQTFPTGTALMAACGAASAAVVIGQAANAFACRSTCRWPGALGWTGDRLLIGAVAIDLLALPGFCSSPRWPRYSTVRHHRSAGSPSPSWPHLRVGGRRDPQAATAG